MSNKRKRNVNDNHHPQNKFRQLKSKLAEVTEDQAIPDVDNY